MSIENPRCFKFTHKAKPKQCNQFVLDSFQHSSGCCLRSIHNPLRSSVLWSSLLDPILNRLSFLFCYLIPKTVNTNTQKLSEKTNILLHPESLSELGFILCICNIGYRQTGCHTAFPEGKIRSQKSHLKNYKTYGLQVHIRLWSLYISPIVYYCCILKLVLDCVLYLRTNCHVLFIGLFSFF